MNTLNILQNTPTSSSTSTPVATAGPAIDSQGFLRLLITQLQHQDPLTPTDPGNTVLQLASLAQVSTLQEISALLKQLLAAKDTPVESAPKKTALAASPDDEPLPPLLASILRLPRPESTQEDQS